MYKLSSFIIFIFFSFFALAEDVNPYFVSTKSNEVNVRTGPSTKYPVKWKILRLNEPLKVTKKFEYWRNIVDSSGDSGWVHVSNICTKPYIKIISQGMTIIFEKPDKNSKVVFKTENDVLFKLLNCDNSWCKIEKNGLKGWIKKIDIWGSE